MNIYVANQETIRKRTSRKLAGLITVSRLWVVIAGLLQITVNPKVINIA